MTKTLNLCLKFDFLRLFLAEYQYLKQGPVGFILSLIFQVSYIYCSDDPFFLCCSVQYYLKSRKTYTHRVSLLIINNSLTYTFVEHISISFFSIYMKHISLPCCAFYNCSKFLHLLNIFCIYNYFSILSSKLSTSNIYAINDENFLTSITVIQIGKLFPFVVFH